METFYLVRLIGQFYVHWASVIQQVDAASVTWKSFQFKLKLNSKAELQSMKETMRNLIPDDFEESVLFVNNYLSGRQL